MNDTEVRELLRLEISKAGSQLAYAVEHDVDRCSLGKVLAGRLKIPPQVLRALKIHKVITYEKDE